MLLIFFLHSGVSWVGNSASDVSELLRASTGVPWHVAN
jgi:hypothetical protein